MHEVYELDVYQLAEKLSDMIWYEYDKWASKAQHTIGHQIIRSADSIAANIAEGYGRFTPADRKRFYHYSRGSFEETKAWLRKALRRKIIDSSKSNEFKLVIDELGPKQRIHKEYKMKVNIPTLTKFQVSSFKFLAIALLPALVHSAELSVDEIISRANQAAYYAGEDGQADVNMVITDANGGTREREFRILRKDTGEGTQKFYVYFKEPADVRRQVFMVWKEVDQGKDDSRWLFLPALNLVKPIAPGDKRTSFVGSDFVYEDVSGRALWEDSHELIGETDTHYIVKNIPKTPDEVDFSEYTVWIDKETFLPVKSEYLDKNGKLYRRVEALKTETVAGFPTVMESKVTDITRGTHTVNTFSNIKYNIGLNERLFTERFLRRPPREATK